MAKVVAIPKNEQRAKLRCAKCERNTWAVYRCDGRPLCYEHAEEFCEQMGVDLPVWDARVNEKPVHIPLSFEQAVEALLQVKPEKKRKP